MSRRPSILPRPATKLVPLQKKLNRNRYRARPAKPIRELRQR